MVVYPRQMETIGAHRMLSISRVLYLYSFCSLGPPMSVDGARYAVEVTDISLTMICYRYKGQR